MRTASSCAPPAAASFSRCNGERMCSDLAIDCIADGCVAAETPAGSDDPLRSGQPVQQLGLAELPQGQQPDQQHESAWQLSRQRCGGKLFQLLKRERIRRKTYGTREEARSDVFDYIEVFYNPKRGHNSAMQLWPVEYEKRYFRSLESV